MRIGVSVKTVVLQIHAENLCGIQQNVACIDSSRADEIIFTADREDVLTVIKGEEPVLVVSGQVLGLGISGTDLARDVKRANPKALFFIYSVMPATNESVDGVIPKRNGTATNGAHELLAKILTSPLDGITATDLKKRFPEIQ